MRLSIVCNGGRGKAFDLATGLALYVAYQTKRSADEQSKSNEIQQEALNFQKSESNSQDQIKRLEEENQNLKEEIYNLKAQENLNESNIKENSVNNSDNDDILQENLFS
jgi:cell division protein FtsB